ncbi:MAG: helix-turn-helix domain-containing protein [Clostridia bacterium]|nr:helix-turn-helix domain-containing protein [Clostridia bacterium]
MESIEQKRKFHFEKNYVANPLKLGNMNLMQIGCTHSLGDYFVGYHPHLNWLEITFITGGAGTIVTNGVSSSVTRGDLYISFPGDVHAIFSDNESPLKFSFLALWPDEEELQKELEQIMVLNNDPSQRIISNENIEKLIENSISEVILNDKYSNEMLICCLNQIVRYIIRDFSLSGKSKKLKISSAQELCYRITNYISTHIYTMNSLESLAEYFGYSYGYLSGIYHKTTGESLINCYTSRRAEAAKALRNEELLSFAEIAEILKYSSIYSFSRAFKNYFGITPSAYKKQLKA